MKKATKEGGDEIREEKYGKKESELRIDGTDPT